MTSESELFIQHHLSAIVKRLDNIERKLDNLLSSEDPEQVASTDRTEANRISQVVRVRLSKALARKRAKAVAEMNEKF